MITILFIYIIGILIHRDLFGVKEDSENYILDYNETKEVDQLFKDFSVIWPLFWLVFLFIYLKETFLKLKSRIKNENTDKK